jgi:hypothetical protein
VYAASSSLALGGTLTLDGHGDPTAVFIFQIGSTLTTWPESSVNLMNGAQACNVFWQVGSSATLDTASVFTGTIMAFTSITMNTGAVVEGQALALNGAVTLDSNQFTRRYGVERNQRVCGGERARAHRTDRARRAHARTRPRARPDRWHLSRARPCSWPSPRLTVDTSCTATRRG